MKLCISISDLKSEMYANAVIEGSGSALYDALSSKKLSSEQIKTVAEFLFNVLVKEKK